MLEGATRVSTGSDNDTLRETKGVGTPPTSTAVALQYYKVLSQTENGGVFRTDARVIWQTLGSLKLNAGDTIRWHATGIACAAVPGGYRCETPDGHQVLSGFSPWAEHSTVDPQEFEVGHAHFYSLLMKVGGVKFEAGSSGSYTVPEGQKLDVATMRNMRVPTISTSSGGDEIQVSIDRGPH